MLCVCIGYLSCQTCTSFLFIILTTDGFIQLRACAGCSRKKYNPFLGCILHNCAQTSKCLVPCKTTIATSTGLILEKLMLLI